MGFLSLADVLSAGIRDGLLSLLLTGISPFTLACCVLNTHSLGTEAPVVLDGSLNPTEHAHPKSATHPAAPPGKDRAEN